METTPSPSTKATAATGVAVNPAATIRAVEVFPVWVPSIRAFKFASGSATTRDNRAPLVLVKVTDSEGRIGWGEGRPLPNWSYETFESVVSTLRHYLVPAVLGGSIWDWSGLHARMHAAVGRGPSTGMPVAKAALDIAVFDLCGVAANVPLRCLLGGSPHPVSVPLSWTCTAHEPGQAKDDVAAGVAAGFRHFNFKAAVHAGSDIAVAETIATSAPAGAFLWADANQGLRLHEACRLGDALQELGVHLLEQPLPADQLHLMAQLRARTGIPLAVDEATVSPADFFAYARAGLIDFFVLKITRSAGIWPSIRQMHTALSAGLPFVTSGLTDGLITKVAACQVAAAFGAQYPCALNGSQFMDESALYPDKVTVENGGAVHLNSLPGLGVRPDEGIVRAYLDKSL